ncbi:MAG: hypothetical protein EBR01_01100 [Proteobacteria bacterium]|nr:hypothetical protein [Pseudomonadota bacterium]
MDSKHFVLLGLLVSSLGSLHGSINPSSHSLKSFVATYCEPLERNMGEYAVCPKVEVYEFNNLSEGQALAFVETHFGLSLLAMDQEVGVTKILVGLENQSRSIRNVAIQLGCAQTKSTAKKFHHFVRRFARKLRQDVLGKVLYWDPATEWAPSVEAIALVVIDLKHSTIEIVYHGLTDG